MLGMMEKIEIAESCVNRNGRTNRPCEPTASFPRNAAYRIALEGRTKQVLRGSTSRAPLRDPFSGQTAPYFEARLTIDPIGGPDSNLLLRIEKNVRTLRTFDDWVKSRRANSS